MIGESLKQEIMHTFVVVKDRSNAQQLTFLCPECGDTSGNRSVSLVDGLTNCWRCNKGRNNKGSFIGWARALGYHFVNKGEPSRIPIEDLMAKLESEVDDEYAMPVVTPVKLPEGFTPIANEPKSAYSKWIAKMAKRKNLSFDLFAAVGCGFTRNDPLWEPFAIFPVHDYRVPVYYQGRTYVDVPEQPTKKFPHRSKVPNGASCWVYGIDEVRAKKPRLVVVVESILNVLSLRVKFSMLRVKDTVPVCVFKHAISDMQAVKLRNCGVEELCLLFDHDAINQAWAHTASLSNSFKLTVAEMPAGDNNEKLDANDDVDAAIEAIENRFRYSMSMARGRMMDANTKEMTHRAVDLTSAKF